MSQFSITTKVFFGKDAVAETQKYTKTAGINELLFIVDKNISHLSALSRLVRDYVDSGFKSKAVKPFDASMEPTYEMLDEFTETIRHVETDAIIAIGGGSVMDIAKGVGILLRNPGKGLDYRGMDKVRIPGVPVICYPTTAGTGSEVTHTASFIDTESKTKLGINGRYVSPLIGVLQPELTFSCPPKVTVFSCLDAMVHAVEAVSAKTANRITSMLGNQAFSLLYSNIRKVLQEPYDYDAREGMQIGSYLAGIALMNAGGGPASALSYPLGVHYNVPHGIAGGIFLPYVFEFNVSMGYRGYAMVYNSLPDADLSLSNEEKSRDFVRKFNALYEDIGGPKKLSEFGVGKEEVKMLTELTMEQRAGNLELNPVPFGKDETVRALQTVT